LTVTALAEVVSEAIVFGSYRVKGEIVSARVVLGIFSGEGQGKWRERQSLPVIYKVTLGVRK